MAMGCCTPRTRSYKTVLLRAIDEASFGRTLSATVGLGRAFGAHIVGTTRHVLRHTHLPVLISH